MKREELIKSNEFWLIQIQNKLFNLIDNYRKEKKVNQTQIAAHLGVTKGYVSQVLNGDYDHKISKLVDLSLAFGKAPVLSFVDLEIYIKEDKEGKNSLSNPQANTINYWISLDTNTVIKIDPKFNTQFKNVEDYFINFSNANIPTKSEAPKNDYISYSELNEAK